ncbi:MAG: hypothetical protein PHE73_03575 [Sulfurovaceae bacterium]|nr:hypothetical protein [Sulfurovaceae bacterium]
MKIKLLVGRVSLEGAHKPGEIISVDDREALALISSIPSQAEAVNKAEFKNLVERVEKNKQEEFDKQAQIIAIQKKEELTNEADTLLENTLAIVATLSSNDPEFKDRFLESFHEKWLVAFPEDDANAKADAEAKAAKEKADAEAKAAKEKADAEAKAKEAVVGGKDENKTDPAAN